MAYSKILIQLLAVSMAISAAAALPTGSVATQVSIMPMIAVHNPSMLLAHLERLVWHTMPLLH